MENNIIVYEYPNIPGMYIAGIDPYKLDELITIGDIQIFKRDKDEIGIQENTGRNIE